MASPEEGSAPLEERPNFLQQLTEANNLISAFKWGIIAAAAYYVLGILLNLLTNAILNVGADPTKNPLVLVPLCLSLFALVFAIYVAGYLPGMERGQVAPGVMSAGIMVLASNLLSRLFNPAPQSTTASGSLVTQIVALLFFIIVALGIGWLGAFYGVKRNARKATTEHA